VIRKTTEDAKALIGKDQVATGTALTPRMLQERIDTMRGAVTMAFPMGLPENDTIRLLFEDADDMFLQDLTGPDYMDPSTATLWWAGKEFFRDQTIVARLQRKGGGAPVREPAVSEDERKAMMSWYFKKQEEEKALAEDKEDAHLGGGATGWADPKALKRDLMGTGNIGFRPAGMGRR
jgi:cilia- and flagella-associated protein 298